MVRSSLLISLALLLALVLRQRCCIKFRTPRLAPEKYPEEVFGVGDDSAEPLRSCVTGFEFPRECFVFTWSGNNALGTEAERVGAIAFLFLLSLRFDRAVSIKDGRILRDGDGGSSPMLFGEPVERRRRNLAPKLSSRTSSPNQHSRISLL